MIFIVPFFLLGYAATFFTVITSGKSGLVWLVVVGLWWQGRKRGKRFRRVGIFAGGHFWPPPTPKAELRPKAADFEEVIQGWPLSAVSPFPFRLGQDPKCLHLFPLFLDQHFWSPSHQKSPRTLPVGF